MRQDVLKNERGGYNKISVLTKIDALNALIMMAEGGDVSRDAIAAELEKVRAIVLKREKGGFFGTYGFSVEDTDSYIAKLEEQLEEKLR